MDSAFRVSLFLVLLGSSGGEPLAAQVTEGKPDTTLVVADPGDIASVARAAQALFERRRLRHLPLSLGASGGTCDEHVGRFCTWYGEGEWFPVPESDVILTLRSELLATLDSLQSLAPADDWILGQRVWYRSEGGDWDGALGVARACRDGDEWWCAALGGFALHGLDRFVEAQAQFEHALAGMGEARAREWRVPDWTADPHLRDLLEDAAYAPDVEAALLERMWRMADPLYLVDGNDRLTAHYARWTVATLRDRARNPFHISWGRDLDELTVRHGWEMGWERSTSRSFAIVDGVIGHKHPEGRDYMPAGQSVEDPANATAHDLSPGKLTPRSLYAPRYAPVLLPMGGQVAVFPRGPRMVIVATSFLPEDTTFHVGHRHALPWMEPHEQAGLPDRRGLFASPLEGGRAIERVTVGGSDGTSMIDVPLGSYLVSSESWSPERRRAGRLRRGVAARPAPEDIATLSDILLLRSASPSPPTLEAALDRTLLRPRVRSGEPFAIGWEIAGLGFRPEVLHFEVSVGRTDRGFIGRVGDFLHLSSPPRPLILSWEEPGPDDPGYHFRSLDLDVPALEPGQYEIRLVLRSADRTDAVTTRTLQVVDPRDPATR